MHRVIESQHDWVAGYDGGSILHQENDEPAGLVRRIMCIRHRRLAGIVAPRHYTYFEGFGPIQDATVQVSQSIEWPDAPRPAGSVTARLLFASRRIGQAPRIGYSHVDIIWQVDMGGWLGQFPGLVVSGMVDAFFNELVALQRMAGKAGQL